MIASKSLTWLRLILIATVFVVFLLASCSAPGLYMASNHPTNRVENVFQVIKSNRLNDVAIIDWALMYNSGLIGAFFWLVILSLLDIFVLRPHPHFMGLFIIMTISLFVIAIITMFVWAFAGGWGPPKLVIVPSIIVVLGLLWSIFDEIMIAKENVVKGGS